jgi:predicted transcriptional regulator
MTDTTITVRVSAELKQRLEAVAKETRRSKSFLSNEAIKLFVQNEEEFIESIRQAEMDIDEGRGLSQEDVARVSQDIISDDALKKAS